MLSLKYLIELERQQAGKNRLTMSACIWTFFALLSGAIYLLQSSLVLLKTESKTLLQVFLPYFNFFCQKI